MYVYEVNDTWLLNDYKVNEFAEPLKDAYQMKFEYHVNELQSRYFHIYSMHLRVPFRQRTELSGKTGQRHK